MAKRALFLNGVYEDVLQEISASQAAHPGEFFFLRPYKPHRMTVLAASHPSPEEPVRVYLSTTSDLNHVRYDVQIVGWEDRRHIPADRMAEVNEKILGLQPKEKEIYKTAGRGECRHLLFIRDLQQLPHPMEIRP